MKNLKMLVILGVCVLLVLSLGIVTYRHISSSENACEAEVSAEQTIDDEDGLEEYDCFYLAEETTIINPETGEEIPVRVWYPVED